MKYLTYHIDSIWGLHIIIIIHKQKVFMCPFLKYVKTGILVPRVETDGGLQLRIKAKRNEKHQKTNFLHSLVVTRFTFLPHILCTLLVYIY